MRLLLKQPLVWFLVISACIFVIDSLSPEPREEIFVTNAQRDRLALLWNTQTGQDASEEELNALINNWLEEEVLFREALRLGLDQDDSIIRRRLVQKLGFIAEADMESEPEIAELEAFYKNNISNYTLPLRYSIRQLFFSSRESALDAISAYEEGSDISSSGQNSMLNSSYAFRSKIDLNVTFGSGFAEQLEGLAVNKWQGPLQSSFGYHLVLIAAVHEEEAAPLESILDRVLSDYTQYQKQISRKAYVNNLLNDYEIRREDQ